MLQKKILSVNFFSPRFRSHILQHREIFTTVQLLDRETQLVNLRKLEKNCLLIFSCCKGK